MTTYTSFVPSPQVPFQFQPTLDGQVYTAIVTWNLFGQRYYVNLYDLSGTVIFTLPLIGSPDGVIIQALSWLGGFATATTEQPHGYLIGTTANLEIVGANPSAFGGDVQGYVIDPTRFQYPIASDPGQATAFGTVFADVSITAGYFDSTMVFRTSSQQFEVSP